MDYKLVLYFTVLLQQLLI